MVALLVVTPAAALAASLQFMLEAGGYAVTVAMSRAEADHRFGPFDCTVLDHHAVPSRPESEAIAFMERRRPIVLLVNQLPHALSDWSFRTVTKPLLGEALSLAVRDAVASRPA